MWCGAKFVSANRGVRVFPHCTNHEIVAAMTGRQFIGQALRILVVIGLALGPISAVSSAAAMMHETMADDMPCRPLDQTTAPDCEASCPLMAVRSEEHTSELQSLMRIPYSVFCLKKKK